MSAPAEEAIESEVQPGDVLAGKYRVEKILGAGGMGVVVQATHIVLNDRVALKFLLPSVAQHETTAARFLREAQAAVRIKSPHVARVVDVGTMEDSGSPYMVMEYLEGQDLSQLVESEGQVALQPAVIYTLQVCEALAAAHSAGIVHRDIKPANIFLTYAGDGSPVAKVLDFGISKVASDLGISSLTQTQVSMGSPLYMSPEQMRSARDVDARTDIWSLGVVLYEMITGTLPFVADSMPQLCALVLENTAPPMRGVRPDVPVEIDRVVARCLEKNPALRYQSVAELANDLAPFAGDYGLASAGRVGRILAGGGAPHQAGSVDSPRGSMISVGGQATTGQALGMTDRSHSTETAFGATGPFGDKTTQVAQPRKTPIVIAAVAVCVGLGATIWGFSSRANQDGGVRGDASTTVLGQPPDAQALGQGTDLQAPKADNTGEIAKADDPKKPEQDADAGAEVIGVTKGMGLQGGDLKGSDINAPTQRPGNTATARPRQQPPAQNTKPKEKDKKPEAAEPTSTTPKPSIYDERL